MSRRNRGFFWGQRSSFGNSSDSDEFPLAFLLARRAPARKKKTPTKRATPRRTRQNTRRAQAPVAVVDLLTPVRSGAADSICVDPPIAADSHVDAPVIDLTAVKSKVGTKINDFFQSGRFLSSDEEDTVEEPANPPVAAAKVEICLSDDSDVEVSVTIPPVEASTSMTSQVQQVPENKPIPENKPELEQVKPNDNDSFMDYVDSVLSGCDKPKPATEGAAITDMKSLADFSKETEEMLKDASSLLDELRGTKKQEEEQKKTEEAKRPPPPEPEAPSAAACPICYEPYSNVAAAATICGHIFCKQCITMACKTNKKCPTCRKPLTMKKIHPIYFN